MPQVSPPGRSVTLTLTVVPAGPMLQELKALRENFHLLLNTRSVECYHTTGPRFLSSFVSSPLKIN